MIKKLFLYFWKTLIKAPNLLIYIYIHTYTHIYIYMCVCVCVYICVCVYVCVAQNRDRWWALVKAVMNFRVP